MKTKTRIESAQSLKNGIAYRTSYSNRHYAVTTINEGEIKKELLEEDKIKVVEIGEKAEGILGLIFLLAVGMIFHFADGWIDKLRAFVLIYIVIVVAIYTWMSIARSETFKFHSAEHMAINAYSNLGRAPTLEEIKTYSRLNNNCGSNYAFMCILFSILILVCTFVFDLKCSIIVLLPSIVVLEILRRWGALNFIQYLTTRKPTDRELKVAIEGLRFWEECEEKFSQKKKDEETRLNEKIKLFMEQDD